MRVVPPLSSSWGAVKEDLAKFPAFFRRDLLVLWSYRLAFFADWVNMIIQVLVFFFVSRLVPSSRLPSFGGHPTTYLQFVTVSIALTAVMQVTLGQVVQAVRSEQALGTLEALMVTPTALSALQLGSVVYDLLYMPLRTTVFLILMYLLLGVRLAVSGLLPTAALFLLFMPFVWGLGVLSAAAVLTFRRGHGSVAIGVTLLTLSSGAYFPIQYFPSWLQRLAALNPITSVLDGAREALLGNAGWSGVFPAMVPLVPLTVVTLTVAILAFRAAVARERRRGTLGLY
jgi:ABC-2 type transport system permease protein